MRPRPHRLRPALVAAVAALALGSLMAGCKGTSIDSGTAGSKSNVVKGDAAATTAPPSDSKSRSDVQITGKGFTQLPPDSIGSSYVSYAVVIANPNEASVAHPDIAEGVKINITFKNAAGGVVKSESETISFVLPGESMAAAGHTEASGVASMEVQALVDDWGKNDAPITGRFTPSQVTTKKGSYGDMTTTGVVNSTFAKDYKDVEAVAVYRNANNDILGGDSTFVDFIPGGGQVSFEIRGYNNVPNVAKTDALLAVSNLSLFEANDQ